MTKAKSALAGRWRIVEANLWDRDFLDLCGSATLVVGSDGHGEIQLGAVQVGLDIAHNQDEIDTTWCGFDAINEVQGSRSAELQDNGSLIIDSSTISATKPSLKPCETLHQQPANPYYSSTGA